MNTGLGAIVSNLIFFTETPPCGTTVPARHYNKSPKNTEKSMFMLFWIAKHLANWSLGWGKYVIRFKFYANSKKQFFDRSVRRRARALLVLRARSVHPKLRTLPKAMFRGLGRSGMRKH